MPIDIEKDDVQTALKKLKARENTLHQFEVIANLGRWEVDLKTQVTTWSDTCYSLYGVKIGTPVNLEDFFQRLLPQYRLEAHQLLQKAIQTKSSHQLSM
ncbi:MAG: hypothetical protein Q9M40_13555 [Sulfurimonas sp.]|nr:hypothetical protein [Sulfurimonas sp.]